MVHFTWELFYNISMIFSISSLWLTLKSSASEIIIIHDLTSEVLLYYTSQYFTFWTYLIILIIFSGIICASGTFDTWHIEIDWSTKVSLREWITGLIAFHFHFYFYFLLFDFRLQGMMKVWSILHENYFLIFLWYFPYPHYDWP